MHTKMRIVHVNIDDNPRGGATIAMLRLHQALLREGVESLIACPGNTVSQESLQWPRGLRKWIVRCLVMAQNVVLKIVWKQTYSINLIPSGLAGFINRLQPDIVHLHWIQANAMSFKEIRQIKAPLVWSLHDCWPMLGLDAIPKLQWHKTGIPQEAHWLDRWVWRRKCETIKAARITPIVASHWLLKEVKASIAFQGQEPVFIPLALDAMFFEHCDSSSHEENQDKYFTILFGSTRMLVDHGKGFDRLVGALATLAPAVKANMRVVVFGSVGVPAQVPDVPLRNLGKIEGKAIREIYRGSHVLAFPSRAETCGQVKLEALACGVPVIAFNETACAEGIIHQETGWIAMPNDIEDFGRGLLWAYELWQDRRRQAKCMALARESMAAHHSPRVVAQSLLKTYNRLIDQQP